MKIRLVSDVIDEAYVWKPPKNHKRTGLGKLQLAVPVTPPGQWSTRKGMGSYGPSFLPCILCGTLYNTQVNLRKVVGTLTSVGGASKLCNPRRGIPGTWFICSWLVRSMGKQPGVRLNP